MTTAWEALRTAFSRDIGDWLNPTCTSAGASGGTTVVSTELNTYDDDYFNGWWVRITSGTYDGVHREVTDFVGSTGTLTVRAFAGQIANSVTFELHRYNPDDLLRAVNAAAEILYPDLHRIALNDTLVVDNDLLNPSFDDWTAADPDSWTAVNSPTSDEETSLVWHGSALKLTGPAGDVGQEYQALTRNIKELAGKPYYFKMMGWSNAASEARIGLDFGASHASNKWSSYHGGTSDWRLLEVSQTVPTDATRLWRIVEVAATKVAYFDAGYSYCVPLYRLTMPSAIKEGPYSVGYDIQPESRVPRYMPWKSWVSEDDGTSRYIRFTMKPPAGRRLLLDGLNYLTALTTDASTIEIDGPRVSLLIAQAAACLFGSLAGPASGAEDRTLYRVAGADWQARANALRTMPGMRMAKPGAQLHGRWSYG